MEIKTLADYCLITIARNLDHSLTAYNNDEDGAMEILFLQRYYADELMSQALLQGEVKTEHFPLLLNKYLHKIDLELFIEHVREAEKKRNSQGVGTFLGALWRKLIKWNRSLEDDLSDFIDTNLSLVESALCNLSNLKKIQARCICTDDLIETVATCCPLLEKFDFSHSPKVSDSGILQICQKRASGKVGNPLLRKLIGWPIELKDETFIRLLENLPSLEDIKFGDFDFLSRKWPILFYNYHEKEFRQGCSLRKYNLRTLFTFYIEYPLSLNVLRLWAELCPNVMRLFVRVHDQDTLNECLKFSKLRQLFLHSNISHAILDVNIFLNMKYSNLRELELDSVSFSIDDLIMSFPSLNKLNLLDPLFQSIKHDCVPQFQTLQSIELKLVDWLQPHAMKSISLLFSSCTVLKELSISGLRPFNQELSSEILRICSLNPVQYLAFEEINVDYRFFKELLEVCRNLRCLAVLESNLDRMQFSVLEHFAATLRNRPKIDYNIL